MAKGGIEGVVCDVVSGDDNGGDERLPVNNIKEKGLMRNSTCRREMCCSDESSSSIGKNSDLSDEKKSVDCEEDEEVQSSYKGPLDAMETLEEVLPIRRGISRFYNGKSKSFASLADASSLSSSSSIAKPENPYTRRRRNLLACSLLAWDKTTRNNSALRGNNGGGISKRGNNTTKTTLALAVAMTQASKDDEQQNGGRFHSDFSPSWRSFSMADLQQHK